MEHGIYVFFFFLDLFLISGLNWTLHEFPSKRCTIFFVVFEFCPVLKPITFLNIHSQILHPAGTSKTACSQHRESNPASPSHSWSSFLIFIHSVFHFLARGPPCVQHCGSAAQSQRALGSHRPAQRPRSRYRWKRGLTSLSLHPRHETKAKVHYSIKNPFGIPQGINLYWLLKLHDGFNWWKQCQRDLSPVYFTMDTNIVHLLYWCSKRKSFNE